jgi:hypothetical protein
MKKLQQRFLFRSVSVLLIVLPVLSLLYWGANRSGREVQAAQPPSPATNEIAVLRADIERLKGMVPDQSHAMKDVAYHFANLWFAGEKKNWPLAEFYWSESRSIPVRKDPKGNEIRLAEILDPIEKTALEDVHKAINEKNNEKFANTYKQMLESCYACHLAVGKPFLKLQVPNQPEAPIVRFEPEP